MPKLDVVSPTRNHNYQAGSPLRDLNVIIFVCFSYLTSKMLWLRKYHHCTAQSWTGPTNRESPPPFSNATSHAHFSQHPSDAQGPGFLLIKAKQTTHRKTCLERHQPPAQQCEFCGLCINTKSVFYTLIPGSSSSHNFKEIKSMLITTKPVFYIFGLKLDMAYNYFPEYAFLLTPTLTALNLWKDLG